MKTISFLSTILILFCTNSIYSQQNCKVLNQDINIEYSGDCKKNLAHGNGIAKGVNTFEGEFKNGYPHGKGTMIYKDGSIYKGNWKKGERNGEGKYTFQFNNKDSVSDGIWKNDQFAGAKVLKSYEVTRKNSVPRYVIRKSSDNFDRVTISIKNGGTSFPVPQNIYGSSGNLVMSMGRAIFENITNYPFECEMRYTMPTKLGTSSYDAEFNFKIIEKGDWVVEISH